MLRKEGFESVTLGRYILRAETAAFYLMCLAHHQNLLGEDEVPEGRQNGPFLV